MGIFFNIKKTHFKQEIICMNCFAKYEYKILLNTKIENTEIICEKCGLKDKVRKNLSNFGDICYYIN